MSEIAWGKKTKDTERQQSLKRRALLETAAHVFTTQGYANTSIGDLADRLQVSKPALYYYVRSKEDILVKCTEISLEILVGLFKEVNRPELTGLESVRAYFQRYCEICTGDFGYALIREGDKHLGEENKRAMRERMAQGQRALEQLVRAGMKDGSIVPGEPKYVAFVLFSTFNQMAFWYEPDGELGITELADRLLDIVSSGIATRP